MYLQNELQSIAKRLFEERICLQPLDERSLKLIHRYMGSAEAGADLVRRLSDIELNCEEISEEADDAVDSVNDFIICCENIFKALIDGWSKQGLVNGYSLSVSPTALKTIRHSYSVVTEALRSKIHILAETSAILAELAVQLKACSASFLEVNNETRLAYYAAALNKDTESLLSCKALALQSRDSASECKRNSAQFLSASKASGDALSVINGVLSEATAFFGGVSEARQINTTELVNIFIRGIEQLKNITSSLK